MKHPYLAQIEDELNALAPSLRQMLYISIFLIIIALGWFNWISSLINSFENLHNDIESTQIKIYSIDLNRIDTQIASIKQQILKLKEKLSLKRSAKLFIEKEVSKKKFSFLKYRESDFIHLLKSILKYSEEYGLLIDNISTPNLSEEESVNEAVRLAKKLAVAVPVLKLKKRVVIEGIGSYRSVIRLLYRVESEHNLLYVKYVNLVYLEKDRSLSFKIELNHYGVGQ